MVTQLLRRRVTLISGGEVFVTVANSGSTYGTRLYALNKSTGATAWSQPIAGDYFWSTAAFDAGQVFVLNTDGLLKAFAATTGQLDWSAQLSQGSYSSPPTASDGIVFAGGAGLVSAVSESSGQLLWTEPVENGDNSSPALNGTSVFVSYACGLTYSFARTTGAQQWFHDGPCEGGGGTTPVVSGGSVYMRDTYNGNEILNAKTGKQTGTFAAGPAPAFDGQVGLFLNKGTLSAVTDGTTQWSFAGDGGLDSAPVVVNSTVYIGSSTGKLYGLALSTGHQVWSTNVGMGIPAPDEQNVTHPLTGLGAAKACSWSRPEPAWPPTAADIGAGIRAVGAAFHREARPGPALAVRSSGRPTGAARRAAAGSVVAQNGGSDARRKPPSARWPDADRGSPPCPGHPWYAAAARRPGPAAARHARRRRP